MTILPWHRHAIEYVKSTRAANRLPHALLIKSYDGWGEREFANWLALDLLGQPESLDARAVAHPDLLWVQPDGAVVKVNAIRELAEFAVRTRGSADCKVAVVEQAHLLNDNAANALLKTLEEPPADTYVILTTCRPGKLLPTIISRCHSIVLHPDKVLARQWLMEQWTGDELTQKMFEYANAPLLVAESFAAQEPSLAPVLNELAVSAHPTAHVQSLLNLDSDRLMTRWYRYCVALLSGEPVIPAISGVAPRKLCEFVDELVRIRRQLAFTNSANARVLLERLVTRWRGLSRTVPTGRE